MTAALIAEGLHTYYGKSHILHGVSLAVGRAEVVGLLGRNGVGKSTTLKAIAGLVRPSRGGVLFEGQSIARLPAHRLARLGIGYVPEDRRIFRFLTVNENLRTGLDRHGVTKARKKALLDKVYSYFPVLAERRNQAGGTLSGGEQQMLAIARSMMLEPKIILLDEPTEGLMPRMVSQIREIIDVLRRDGVAVLLVEQNVPLDARCLPACLHYGERRGSPSCDGIRPARRRRRHPPVSGCLMRWSHSGSPPTARPFTVSPRRPGERVG
jgi:branched-chain amino acid transport system ATP-binding protein